MSYAMFPCVVEFGDARIMLYADGTASGDPDALARWLTRLGPAAASPGGRTAVVAWLVLRALQDDRLIERLPRFR